MCGHCPAMQKIVDLRRSVSSANGKEEGGRETVKQIKNSAVDGGAGVHLEEDGGGWSRSEVGRGQEVSAGDEELVLEWEVPVELRQMHPAIARNMFMPVSAHCICVRVCLCDSKRERRDDVYADCTTVCHISHDLVLKPIVCVRISCVARVQSVKYFF
jgi:hypothetical protein